MAIEKDFSAIFRRFGVRTLNLLPTPRMFDITRWEQPRSGVYHYVPFSHLDLGPDAQWTPVREAMKPPYLKIVDTYSRMEGKPRSRAGVNYIRLEREYLREHDEFRRMLDPEKAMLDLKTAIVYDYAKLHLGWRYVVNPMTRWHMFVNLFATVFDNVAKVAEMSDRPQFIFVPTPDNMPRRDQFALAIENAATFTDLFRNASDELKIALDLDPEKAPAPMVRSYEEVYGDVAPWLFANDEDNIAAESFDELPLSLADGQEFDQALPLAMEAINTRTLRIFTDDKLLFAEELHRWLSDNRETSLINAIAERHLRKVNLVFTEMGKFSIINLGELNEWRKSDPKDNDGQGYSALAKRLESFYLSLMGLRSDADPIRLLTAISTGTEDSLTTTPLAVTGGSVADTPAMQEAAKSDPSVKLAAKPTAKPDAVDADIPIATQIPVEPETVDAAPIAPTGDPLTWRMEQESTELLRKGVISPAESRRFVKLANSYKTLKVGDETLEKAAELPQQTIWDFKPTRIPDIPEVTDKGMLESTVTAFDRKYIREVYQRETLRMILAVQKGPVAVTGISKERHVDLMTDTHEYAAKLTPARGVTTTFKFKLPVIDDNGKFRTNGVRYFARKLRTDRPIRKINGNEVALSSYYPNKLFVKRSDAKAYDWGQFLTSEILKQILSEGSPFSNVVYGDNFHSGLPVPRGYSALAREYTSFTYGAYNWHFAYNHIAENFPEYKGDKTPIAKSKKGDILTLGKDNMVYSGDQRLGSLTSMLGLAEGPVEVLTMTVLDKDIPLGIVLAYILGLRTMIAQLGAPVNRRPRGTRREPIEDAFEVTFADEVWTFKRDSRWQTMVWASLNQWHKALKQTPAADLWTPDGYFMLFHRQGCSSRHLTELENLNDYFIDPITSDILEEMKVPTHFTGLLKTAAEMLDHDDYPHELDSRGTLIRGYERFNGAVYREMVRGIRAFKNSRNPSRAGISVNPFAVSSAIREDPSVSQVEDSNPVRNVKEKENVTASGTGGRSKRALVRRHRAMHITDIGIRSEANVDSGDVGINYYTSANPNLTSLRGTVEPRDPTKATVTQLLSTPGNLAPFTTYDDGKRVSFVSIQQEHTIAAAGYRAAPISTGYDLVLAHRCDPMFATTADDDGKVIAIEDSAMVVKYRSGETRTVPLGRMFGMVTGHSVPHMLRTRLKVGESFKSGENLTYNDGFFEPDYRNSTQVRWKSGVPAYVFLDETNENFEDSSRISRRLANLMVTKTGHIRTVIARADQFPVNPLKNGVEVDVDTILMELSDDITESVRANASGARSDLINMGSDMPRAKEHGVLERITCVYFCDKEQMHPKMREFVNKFDNYQAKQHKLYGEGTPKSCRITEPVRVDGNPLEFGQIAFQFHITNDVNMGDGDKMVVANQLKTVITGVIDGLYETVEEVFPGKGPLKGDVDFSYRAVNARIVNSPILMGIGALCQEQLGYELADTYFK